MSQTIAAGEPAAVKKARSATLELDEVSGAQLAGLLGGIFGFLPEENRPNVSAAARGLTVSRSTVYRWLNGQTKAPARIPPARLAQVLARSARPSQTILRQEAIDLRHAREALVRLRKLRSKAVLPEWHREGWLQPHVVAVVNHPELGLTGVVSPRNEEKLLERAAAGGVIQQRFVTSTRFAARLLVAQVLADVDQWRFVPHAMPHGELRRTWLWVDGLGVDLTDAARRAKVRPVRGPVPRVNAAESSGQGTDQVE